MLRKKKAQSTLEYVIVFSVIVAAILAAAPQILTAVQGILDHAATEAGEAANRIDF